MGSISFEQLVLKGSLLWFNLLYKKSASYKAQLTRLNLHYLVV